MSKWVVILSVQIALKTRPEHSSLPFSTFSLFSSLWANPERTSTYSERRSVRAAKALTGLAEPTWRRCTFTVRRWTKLKQSTVSSHTYRYEHSNLYILQFLLQNKIFKEVEFWLIAVNWITIQSRLSRLIRTGNWPHVEADQK